MLRNKRLLIFVVMSILVFIGLLMIFSSSYIWAEYNRWLHRICFIVGYKMILWYNYKGKHRKDRIYYDKKRCIRWNLGFEQSLGTFDKRFILWWFWLWVFQVIGRTYLCIFVLVSQRRKSPPWNYEHFV